MPLGGLSVRSNEAEVFADLDAFIDNIRNVASARAENKLRDQAKTAGFKKINELYKIGPRTMDQYTTLKFAGGSNRAEIVVKGRGFPLYVFQPRQTKAGVSVLVKGRRITIKGAFIAKMRSGHVGVFARGSYGGKSARLQASGDVFGRFIFGRRRLPINELYTFGPAEAFRNAAVIKAMDDRVREQAPKVLAQEFRFASRGG